MAPHPSFNRPPRSLRDVPKRDVLRIAAMLGAGTSADSAAAARQAVLAWVEQRCGGSLPSEAWQHKSFEYLVGGRVTLGLRLIENGIDIWAIRTDDPDTAVAERNWTTEVAIACEEGMAPRLGLRLMVTTPEQTPDFDPASPRLIRDLVRTTGLRRDVFTFADIPTIVESSDDTEMLAALLANPARTFPVFVQSLPDTECPFPVEARTLAQRTAGLAAVFVLPGRFAWDLTRTFGKSLSVFNGAARAYLPGFGTDASRFDHPLFLTAMASIEAAIAARVRMQHIAAAENLRRLRLGHDVLSFASIRAQSLELQSERLSREDAAAPERLVVAHKRIEALAEQLAKAE